MRPRGLPSSRTIQYEILLQNIESLLNDLEVKNIEDNEAETLICQGIEGAYSHIAAMKYGTAPIVFKPTFRDVFFEISGQNYGIVPLDNSTEGMVNEVYDLLLECGLYIIKSIDLTVSHVAMANKNANLSDIRYITAHPQALRQCSKFIEKNNLVMMNSTNNAIAARSIRDSGRTDICCLGDRSNAERYDLQIITDKVNNSATNTTRFIVVADKLIAPKEGGKVSLVFSMDNRSGTLASVLNIIASYGISLSKIESRPIADEKWEYRFYIDIDGNIRDKKVMALIYELRLELPYVKVLGSYDELR